MSLLDKYLENVCYVSGTVIGTKCTVLQNTDVVLESLAIGIYGQINKIT